MRCILAWLSGLMIGAGFSVSACRWYVTGSSITPLRRHTDSASTCPHGFPGDGWDCCRNGWGDRGVDPSPSAREAT